MSSKFGGCPDCIDSTEIDIDNTRNTAPDCDAQKHLIAHIRGTRVTIINVIDIRLLVQQAISSIG